MPLSAWECRCPSAAGDGSANPAATNGMTAKRVSDMTSIGRREYGLKIWYKLLFLGCGAFFLFLAYELVAPHDNSSRDPVSLGMAVLFALFSFYIISAT